MKQSPAPVVNSPDKKLDRMEARREKLLVTIERAERTFEKHDKAAKRWLKRLAVMNGKRRRADKAIVKAKAEAANTLVGSTKPKSVKVDPTTQLGVLGPAPGFNGKGERVPDDGLDIPKNLRREPKRKPVNPVKLADDPNLLQKVEGQLDRQKRMKAMGFHPTKR